MKVCFLIRQLTRGGAQQQLYELARALGQRGYQVTVVAFYEGGALAPRFRELLGPRLRCASKRHRWDTAGFLRRVAREITATDPDIVHAYLGLADIVAMLLSPLFPRVRVVLGVRASQVDWADYGWVARASFLLEGRLSRHADLVIANSDAGRRLFAGAGVAEEKIAVIPNGIDSTRFAPRPDARLRARAEWGITATETVVGIVGRIDPVKGHDTLLRAFAELDRKGLALRLVCIGGGADGLSDDLRRLSRTLGIEDRVHWLGDRDNVAELYSGLDLYVSASTTEGFPNAVAEAMASGVPCVVTDVGDCRFLVGETALVVPPAEPRALARAMEDTLATITREPGRLGVEARERIVREFTIERLATRTDAALKAVLSLGGPAPSA